MRALAALAEARRQAEAFSFYSSLIYRNVESSTMNAPSDSCERRHVRSASGNPTAYGQRASNRPHCEGIARGRLNGASPGSSGRLLRSDPAEQTGTETDRSPLSEPETVEGWGIPAQAAITRLRL